MRNNESELLLSQFVIYRVIGNGWNKNVSFEALFSRKSTLNFRSVRVHFVTSRYNGSHYRSLSRLTLY